MGIRIGALGCVLLVAAALGCGCGGAPSDEDLIDKFIEDVTGKVDDAYVARALGYVDLARFPLDVRVPQRAGMYTEEHAAELTSEFKRGMRRFFYGTEIKLRSRRVDLQGDSAEVELGLMTAVGPLDASLTLRKAAPGSWKVARVHVDQ
jgi:hypothetical protein